jgi:hypothetical protein
VRLARRALERDDEQLVRLRGAASGDLLLFLGDAEELPWADGAVYLGRDPDAPGLLMPTLLAPAVHAPLLERAFRRRFPDAGQPIAVLPGARVLLSAAAARPVDRVTLRAWLEIRG